MSEDEYKKWGSAMFFKKDTAGCSVLNTAVSTDGEGICNNRAYPVAVSNFGASTAQIQQSENVGFRERLQLTRSYSSANAYNKNYGGLTIVDATNLKNEGVSFMDDTAGTADATRIYRYNLLVTIPLKYIADIFGKLPLMKSSYFRLTLNYNFANMALAMATSGDTYGLTSVSLNGSSKINPVMFASGNTNNPGDTLGNLADTTVTIDSNVYKTTNAVSAVHNGGLSSCRLYVPSFKLNEKYNSLYLANPIKTIYYDDIQFTLIKSTSSGSSQNEILSNGLPNVKGIILVPQLTPEHANTGLVSLDIPLQHSPFTSIGSNGCPLASLTNLQAFVGSSSVFQNAVSYDFEHFQQETSRMFAINGGTDTITSGLIGRMDFDNDYRIYCIDTSRLTSDEARSISVAFTNNTQKKLDVYAWVIYEKKITVNTLTGQVVQA
jgi:hypothetical protein